MSITELAVAAVTALAALAFAVAGFQMVSLHSAAGNTIAELFDQATGIFAFGMAGLAILAAILAGIAVDRLVKPR